MATIGPRIIKQEKKTNDHRYEFNPIEPKYSLNQLIVPISVSSSIKDFLAYKEHEELIYKEWGLSETHAHQKQTAINLYGPPGTGKTMAAYAIAKELSQPLIMVDYASLESKYVGETSKNITSIFEIAKENNAIIFFDEADAILSRRVTNMSHSTDVSVNQTRSVLLSLMNNHDGLIIFTTNFIENYDPAFMRRILSHIYFPNPDKDCRHLLWKQYIPEKLPNKANIDDLVVISEGLSGSDISNAVRKAAMLAARKNEKIISLDDFSNVILEIKNSKKANDSNQTINSTKIVSEEYVEQKIGKEKTKELKV